MNSSPDTLEIEQGKPLTVGPHPVRPAWIDYNGHMNITYYVKAFDEALDEIYDMIGCGESYRERSGNSTMTLELHIAYLKEIFEGDQFVMEFLVLGIWDKRVQLYCSMRRVESGDVAATFETMITHVSLAERRSSPFPDWLSQTYEALSKAHASIDRPKQVGRAIGMPVK